MADNTKNLFKILSILGLLMFLTGNILGAVKGAYGILSGSMIAVGLIFFCAIFAKVESRNLPHYINLFFFCFFVLGSFALIYKILDNHQTSWDLTKKKNYSLSPQSVKFLHSIDRNIAITVFASDYRAADDFMKKYQKESEFLKVEIYNPMKDITVAKNFQSEFNAEIGNNDIIIKSGERKKKINGFGEEGITNGIAEVLREKSIKAYFLSGHGEHSINSAAAKSKFASQKEKKDLSVSLLAGKLEEQNVQIEDLNLVKKGYVPQDCDVLICAGPQIDFLPVEVAEINKFLANKGRAIFLTDPAEASNVDFKNLRMMLKEYGIVLNDEIIVDIQPMSAGIYDDPFSPLVSGFNEEHKITKDLKGYNYLIPKARPVDPEPSLPSSINFTPLLYSSEKSWSADIKTILETKKITQPEDAEKMKPQCIGAVVIKYAPSGKEDEETRIAVFGDSDMFTNDLIIQQIPAFLFFNTFHWITAQEDLIAIPPKAFDQTPISISSAKYIWMYLTLVVVIPALILFAGLGYTMMRRKTR